MEDLEAITFRVAKTELEMGRSGLSAGDLRDRGSVEELGTRRLPDVVGELCRRVPLSRAIIVRILKECDKLGQVKINPTVFIDRVAEAMSQAVYQQVAEGIVYHPLVNERWEALRFIDQHQEETVARIVVGVDKSITDKVVCDSQVEEAFAEGLDRHPQVRLFLKALVPRAHATGQLQP